MCLTHWTDLWADGANSNTNVVLSKNLYSIFVHPQAKTTKKIVLKLQCQSCKHVSQHPIKACIFIKIILKQFSYMKFFRCNFVWSNHVLPMYIPDLICVCYALCRGASISRSVETRRGRGHLSSSWLISVLMCSIVLLSLEMQLEVWMFMFLFVSFQVIWYELRTNVTISFQV